MCQRGLFIEELSTILTLVFQKKLALLFLVESNGKTGWESFSILFINCLTIPEFVPWFVLSFAKKRRHVVLSEMFELLLVFAMFGDPVDHMYSQTCRLMFTFRKSRLMFNVRKSHLMLTVLKYRFIFGLWFL